jgi:hypothetical protein
VNSIIKALENAYCLSQRVVTPAHFVELILFHTVLGWKFVYIVLKGMWMEAVVAYFGTALTFV